MANTPEYDRARDYIVTKLKKELSTRLTYHSPAHTVDEVAPAAERLARLEKISEEQRNLLLTAAYYHDSGFIYQRQGHEAASIQVAEKILPEFGYAQDQIAVIRGIILATRIPQAPTTTLERIMADADLDYLGAENFWARSLDLRQELENYGSKFTDAEWYLYQLRFIGEHEYFTASERELRNLAQQRHVREIQNQLEMTNPKQKNR